MTLTSFTFFAFFLIVFLLSIVISARWRWLLLLISSYIFYASWQPEYVFVLLFTTGVTYWVALQMEKGESRRIRLIYLALCLITVLGFLFVFKYYYFFFEYLAKTIGRAGIIFDRPVINLVAPIGISFYSLQIIGYCLNVYRGTQPAEKHLGRYALFVSFFPQVISGPIAKARKLVPQFSKPNRFDRERITIGIHKIMWGVFLKVVIADRLAPVVEKVFTDPGSYQGLTALVAIYFYSFQLYCDFAGYSNIAIGLAKMVGIDLLENFNFPYLSKDINEFWNRWHITLSTWLRDYIFYPVSRSLRKAWPKSKVLARMFFPAVITMLVSGLWHGGGLKFLIWGMIHGGFLFLSIWTDGFRGKLFSKGIFKKFAFLGDWLQILITFNIVSFAWVFFRMENRVIAMAFIKSVFVLDGFILDIKTHQLIIISVVLLILWVVSYFQRRGWDANWLAKQPLLTRSLLYYISVFAYIYLGNFEGIKGFIYAQF
jgi:D-alanyl-lipoteichoic acid acyltransferase DltB (MBOAT superfamily)